QSIAVALGGQIVDAVSSRSPRGSGGVDGRAAASPQAAALGIEGHHLLVRQIYRPHLVRITGAALRRGRENDVVPQVERVRFFVRITEQKRRREISAVLQTERV